MNHIENKKVMHDAATLKSATLKLSMKKMMKAGLRFKNVKDNSGRRNMK